MNRESFFNAIHKVIRESQRAITFCFISDMNIAFDEVHNVKDVINVAIRSANYSKRFRNIANVSAT